MPGVPASRSLTGRPWGRWCDSRHAGWAGRLRQRTPRAARHQNTTGWGRVKMKQTKMSHSKLISRRAMLATTVAMAATPALAEGCQVGPPQHHKGPLVFLDYDQLELDASYDQVYYEPLIRKVSDRLASNSESMRSRIGTPMLHTDQLRLKSSMFIELTAPMRRSSSSSMAGTGSWVSQNSTAIPPRCSSMPGRITSRWTSFR